MERLSITVCWAASARFVEVLKTVLTPTLFSKLNVLWTVGFRISASTNNTRCPDFAKTTAKFADVVDLPSPGPEEVTTNVFIC